jgi:hypothetical protein
VAGTARLRTSWGCSRWRRSCCRRTRCPGGHWHSRWRSRWRSRWPALSNRGRAGAGSAPGASCAHTT